MRSLAGRIALIAAAALVVAPMGPSPAGVPESWRSGLYPEDWQPGLTRSDGAFLHDFSYAGYRNGEIEPPSEPEGATIDVVADHGADPSGGADATGALQAAIDAAGAAGGGVVALPAGTYRVDGLLTVATDGVVVRGAGPEATLLHFTRGTAMTGRAHLTLRGAVSREADIPLAADAESRTHDVRVADATGLAVGDEVAVGWVITDEFVEQHGMTGTWQAFNGQWKPFFRRTVTAVDTSSIPHIVSLDVPLRYDALLRDDASLRRETGYLTECGVEALAVTNAVDYDLAWTNDRVHAIDLVDAADCWVRDVRSAAPPGAVDDDHLQSGGVFVVSSKRVTVTDCHMARAQHRGGGGNGYLFEVSTSGEVLFRDCTAEYGRHNFIQNWDFGTTGCVWLRCSSRGSEALNSVLGFLVPVKAYCEFHHSIATANLVDSCHLEDGWYGGNRGSESSGAGHAATQNVFWNLSGGGLIQSFQYGRGYVIGPGDVEVHTALTDIFLRAVGTAPEDEVETGPVGSALEPPSLYDDQLARRLGLPVLRLVTLKGRLSDDERERRDRVAVKTRVVPSPPTPFDPEIDDLRVEFGDLAWTMELDVAAADSAWRKSRRTARWKSDPAAPVRWRLRVSRRTWRVRISLDRFDLAAPASGPIGVRLVAGEHDASDRRAWRAARRTGHSVTVRLRYP